MSTQKLPEVWLRGALDGVPALLQPVAHAPLQAREELNELMIDFPDKLLWEKLAGMGAVLVPPADTSLDLREIQGPETACAAFLREA